MPWFPADALLFADEEDPRPVEVVEAEIEEDERYMAWLARLATSNSGNRHRSTNEGSGAFRAGSAAVFRPA